MCLGIVSLAFVPCFLSVELLVFLFLLSGIHTTPEKFKSTAISTVRPTVHIRPSRKRSFSKTLFKPEELKNAGFSFPCEPKTFWKRLCHDNHVISLTEFCSNTIVAFSKSPWVEWTGTYWRFLHTIKRPVPAPATLAGYMFFRAWHGFHIFAPHVTISRA